MLARILATVLSFVVMAGAAEARRVALVIGQDSYPGGASAEVGLPPLVNSRNNARSVSALHVKHGFEVISCGGQTPECFDLDRAGAMLAPATACDTMV